MCFKLKKSKNKTKNLSEPEISNSPDQEFRAITIRMLTELGNRIKEYNENFNKELEYI